MLDIGRQCKLALRALDAIVPIAEKAGIKSNPEDAYDEWETLTQAVFEAFVTIPISDTTGRYSPGQFHRLGFDVESGNTVVIFDTKSGRFFIFDFSKQSSGEMVLEAKPLPYTPSTASQFIPIEECSNFALSTI